MCTLSYGKEIRDTTLNARTKKPCDATVNDITEFFYFGILLWKRNCVQFN